MLNPGREVWGHKNSLYNVLVWRRFINSFVLILAPLPAIPVNVSKEWSVHSAYLGISEQQGIHLLILFFWLAWIYVPSIKSTSC